MYTAQNYYFLHRISLIGCLLLLVVACRETSTQPTSPQAVANDPLFDLLPSSQTGVKFQNVLPENDQFNILSYEYYYNGGGVALGDVNNDGLTDVFFTANLVSNRLYLNKGNMQFEEVTKASGVVSREGWKTGVAMADVNGDGWLDIYICRSGKMGEDGRRNELFINQKNGTFKELAAVYGLDDPGYSTHAAFFDYDRDGDLDMYLLNHALTPSFNLTVQEVKNKRDPFFGDKLFRNEGVPAADGGTGKGYVDVSEPAGIQGNPIGFGLSVTIGDIDGDDWPDIFVANDYLEQDYLYINQHNGKFEEQLSQHFKHTSHFSMGSDMGDINNDGLPDLIVLDMLPEDNYGQKILKGPDNYDRYQEQVEKGFYHQLMRNTLQLNLGDGYFSEIGQLAGISNTDWSWSALLADFDNDGNQDLHITNGYVRASTHLDFVKYDYPAAQEQARKTGRRLSDGAVSQQIPTLYVSNYIFRNKGDLTFENKTKSWGLDRQSYSNGAAYGDLDNDGDLDLVVNNIREEAFIYRNNTDVKNSNHYLRVKLQAEGNNTFGIGTKVSVIMAGRKIVRELYPSRGFQSSVEPVLHFGLGDTAFVSALEIRWPDGSFQKVEAPSVDQSLMVQQGKRSSPLPEPQDESDRIFHASFIEGLDYRHQENPFVDFKREPLMPHMLSQLGPCMTVGDVNGDQLDDVFVGGARGQAGALFLQQINGTFISKNSWSNHDQKLYEDTDALFFDVEGDGDMDLYIVSGGNEMPEPDPFYRDRLYLNDGKGNFELAIQNLPVVASSGGCLAAGDFDEDGDVDLFVGGRVIPGRYPMAPRSYLLRNENGQFSDVTQDMAPDLMGLGMVGDAIWQDMDGNGSPELILAGEWMPITILTFQKDKFTVATIPHSRGWWTRLAAHDFDGDADSDLIAGNMGLNAQIKASPQYPASVYAADFDNNGTVEPILSYFLQGKNYPLATRDELLNQLNFLKKKYLRYEDYARTSVEDIFTPEQFSRAIHLQAETFASVYIENKGNGNYEMRPLPLMAQSSPVFGLLIYDFDKDGRSDLLVAGNYYPVRAETGRFDAGAGLLLKGDGKGGFREVMGYKSGFFAVGDVRDMKFIDLKNRGKWVLVANNQGAIEAFQLKN